MMISALAQVNYKPPYFDGTLTVFRVTERPRFEQSDPLNNWKMFAGQVDIINVPGNHKTVLSEPHVQELARAIRECLG
jgi:thioesterase domain-containing protein